jgi:hypothetical protein
MVFDVESIGLHGEGYAVGWVVLDADGKELDARREACPPAQARGYESGRNWVRLNCPPLPETRATPADIRKEFWAAWAAWKAKGAALVGDCGWPVEARFLAACVDDVRPTTRSGASIAESPRDFQGPFPLHELATFMLAAGMDRFNRGERRPEELPEHDPLADARQSARLLREALRRLAG